MWSQIGPPQVVVMKERILQRILDQINSKTSIALNHVLARTHIMVIDLNPQEIINIYLRIVLINVKNHLDFNNMKYLLRYHHLQPM